MKYDIAILGSSFSGSLLAWIVASQGAKVLLLDRNRHPRFAVGESSTPTADFLLEHIARRWKLDSLLPLARWGSWKATYPEVVCGKKRGFSYFEHRPGQKFSDSPTNSSSLLVAASASDELSDTHWLRSDVDQFIFDHAIKAGAHVHQECQLTAISQASLEWQLNFKTKESGQQDIAASANWLIDATGGGGLLAETLKLTSQDSNLKTQTGAIYSHFADVRSWDLIQQQAGNHSTINPFRSDDAAQHHLMKKGWMWMLRFDNDICSVGMVQPKDYWRQCLERQPGNYAQVWAEQLSQYPSLKEMLEPSRMLRSLNYHPRMSRLWSHASGPRWAMLPTTAGFVDPLHSSGIAHALSGVERLAEMLLAATPSASAWDKYGTDVIDEVLWIDRLVHACYLALPDFELFCMAANFYFLSAIDAELEFARVRQASTLSSTSNESCSSADLSFLSARKRPLRNAILECYDALVGLQTFLGSQRTSRRSDWLKMTSDRLGPWNHAGLNNPSANNRYSRTAAPK